MASVTGTFTAANQVSGTFYLRPTETVAIVVDQTGGGSWSVALQAILGTPPGFAFTTLQTFTSDTSTATYVNETGKDQYLRIICTAFAGSGIAYELNDVAGDQLLQEWTDAAGNRVAYVTDEGLFGIAEYTSLTVDATAASPAAMISTTGTTQARYRYDSSNYYDIQVSSAGLVTHEAVGASAGHRFNDPIGFQTVPSANVGVNLQPSSLTGTSQTGLNVQLVASSAATGNAYALIAQAFTASASYNVGAMYGIYIGSPTKQGAATCTNSYGLYVKPVNAGSAYNYGIYVEAPSGGSTINTGIKVNGGDIGINVTNEMLGSATTKVGISTNPEFPASTTATGIAYYAQPTTVAASFTLTNRYAFYADLALKGAGSTITNDFGLYITDVTQGTNNYAIFTNAGLVSFGGPIEIRDIAAASTSANYLSIGSTSQSTVGAAGAASALPAAPSGYLKIYRGSTQYVIPYYAQA